MKNRTSTETPTGAAPICWQREAPSACLRIELESGETYLLPYNHLFAVHLAKPSDRTETLRITFSSHEIQIEGHNLRDLVLGIQDFAIKWLRAVPERYQPLVPSRDAVIVSVRITAVE